MPERDDLPAAQPLWRAWLWPLGLMIVVAVVFVLGKAGALSELEACLDQLERLANSPWGLPALVGMFCLGAYIGVPQFALVSLGVAVFGPPLGFVYGWLATLCSGALTFSTGRWLRAGSVQRRVRGPLAQLTGLIEKNAFIASASVRTIPTGPFLVVNMVFGASGARFIPFWLGLGLGSLPKLALIAFAGEGVIAVLSGSLWRAILFGFVVAMVWIAIGLLAKRLGEKSGSFLP